MPDSLADLKALVLQEVDRFNELQLKVYALQILLQERGQISSAEVEYLVAKLKKTADASYEKHLAEAINKQRQEELRRLLESFEGTRH